MSKGTIRVDDGVVAGEIPRLFDAKECFTARASLAKSRLVTKSIGLVTASNASFPISVSVSDQPSLQPTLQLPLFYDRPSAPSKQASLFGRQNVPMS